jgi:hypothetical protein
MRIWNTEDLAPWTCEYIDIKNLKDTKTVQLVKYFIFFNRIFLNIQFSYGY